MHESEPSRAGCTSLMKRGRLSWALRLVVIASTVLVVGYVIALLTQNGRIVSREFEADSARVFLALVAVSSIGGCVLAVRDKTGWWLAAPLLAIGVPMAMVFALARVGLISFH